MLLNPLKRCFFSISLCRYQNKPITALVIYTGKKVPKRPNSYEMACHGTKLSYWFNYYAVAEQNEADLIANKNIFALIILAIKYVIDTPNDYAQRFAFKKKLFGLLVERNYPYEKRRKLMIFVKNIMRLPNILEKDFITFAKIKVDNDMKAKKQEPTIKEQWKQAEKEWGEIFTEFMYGPPVDVLPEQEEGEITANIAAITVDVAKKIQAEANRKTQGAVLHLYHTIGLTVNQIAESFDFSVAKVQEIINADKNKA